jgi:hypothetical protein
LKKQAMAEADAQRLGAPPGPFAFTILRASARPVKAAAPLRAFHWHARQAGSGCRDNSGNETCDSAHWV